MTKLTVSGREKETGRFIKSDLSPEMQRLSIAANCLDEMESESELRAALGWMNDYFLRAENIKKLWERK